MREYSIPDLDGRSVACPYCRSTTTELFSLFGQQLLTLQYYCKSCHTPFEYVRDEDVRDERKEAPITDQSSSR